MSKYFFILFLSLQIAGKAQLTLQSQMRQFNTENGLPSNGIKGLQWDDKTGFLWLSTEAGIVRYDGVNFRSFTKETMPEIQSERMLFMMRNYANQIYIIDADGNIYKVKDNKPLLIKSNEQRLNPYKDNYYLLSVSDKIFNALKNSQTESPFTLLNDAVVATSDTSCIIVSNGQLYVNGISRLQPLALPLLQGSISQVFKIDSTYFISTLQNQFYTFNINTHKLYPVLLINENEKPIETGTSKIYFFWEADLQNPFIIKGSNLYQVSFSNNQLKATLMYDHLPSDALIKSIKFSKKNNTLFIGTDSKGLFIISKTRVESKKRTELFSKNRNSYYSQIELDNSSVLTNEGDLISNNKNVKIPKPLIGKFTYNVSFTGDSLLWFTKNTAPVSLNCLYSYNVGNGKTKAYNKLRGSPFVVASGNKFYLTNQTGIGVLQGDSIHYEYLFEENFNNVFFDCKVIDSNTIALACCKGLLRYNTKTKVLDTLFSQGNLCVRSIWKYKGYLFFGTYGSGFYIWKNGKLKAMPLDKNKYLQYAHCFMPDNNGFCWISTNRGLFKASLAELIEVYEKNTSSVYYYYFGKNDGMTMTELNGGCTPCALQLQNGIMSFPTMDGLLWVSAKETEPILPSGNIYIDDILVDSKFMTLEELTSVELPPNTTDISIRLSFAAWCNKENIYLDYQINNGENWKPVPWATEPIIQLSNLPRGKYVLRIRLKSGFGFDKYSYKEIKFNIATPWYAKWWFYGFCLFALSGIIWLYTNFKTRQFKNRESKLQGQVAEKTKELLLQNETLEKNNSLKTRLISIISHDIVTPLKFVTGASKKLSDNRHQMNEGLQQETIQEIANTSQELHLLSTNILNWIKYQNQQRMLVKEDFNLNELVRQVFGVVQYLAKEKNIELVNEIDAELTIRQFFEPLKIAVYNIVTNAINFSEKGSITVSCTSMNAKIKITIKDEGVGISETQIANILNNNFITASANLDKRKGHGLGYIIIKDVLKTMDGTLEFESEKNSFTKVSLLIPV